MVSARVKSLIVLVVSVTALGGCASAVRQNAINLAESGTKVAKTTETTVAETRSALDTYVEGQKMLAPLTGRSEPSPAMLKSIAEITEALAAREAVMRQLADTYTALNAHASYDASSKVQEGVDGLTGAINEYGKALNAPAVPSPAAWLLKTAAGSFVGSVQARQLKAASKAIREALEHFETLLQREKTSLVSIRRVLAVDRALVAKTYWELGLGRPTALLQCQVESYGLVYDEKQYDTVVSALRAKPSISGNATRADDLRRAVEAAIDHRAERQANLQEEIIEEIDSALKALIAAHKKFEAKEAADLPALAGCLAAIRGKADEFKKLTSK